MTRILGRAEIIERLKKGEVIHWMGGPSPHAFMGINETVRWDTLCKLIQEGLVTHFGLSELHGTVKLKLAGAESEHTEPKEILGQE